MVRRRIAVLGAGLFDPLLDVLVTVVHDHLAPADGSASAGLIVDSGAGPGIHLGRVLDRLPDRHGLAIDVSKHAARRAAQAHPRAGAVVADVWRGLPVADRAAAAVLDVFAPRHPEEFGRILEHGGSLVVVTPQPDHLAALAGPLGLVAVDPDKDRRLDVAFGARFSVAAQQELRWPMQLDRNTAADVVGMGPGAYHATPDELARRVAALPRRLEVEAAVLVTLYRHRDEPLDRGDESEESG